MKRLLVAGLAAVLAACSGPPPAEKPPRTVLVQTVGESDASALQVYTGEVRARHETDLAFRIGGKLVERTVDVGAQVSPGQVLARLDPQDVRLAASAAQAQVAAAEADLALARTEYARSEDLRKRNFLSESALDARRTALKAAEARLRQARAQAASAGNQAQYAALATDVEGVVIAAPAEAGQVVSAGQPVVRVARTGEREVLIHVPESRIGELAQGAAATVRLWADASRQYAGTVREIAPAADPATRSYAVRVAVPAAGAALPLGATASVAFVAPRQAQALLPLAAVTRIDGKPTVWVVDAASQLRPQPVETGAYREEGVEIRAGLAAGARVVVAGVHRLVEGETVRVRASSAPVALDISR